MYTFSNTGYLSIDDPYVKEDKKKKDTPSMYFFKFVSQYSNTLFHKCISFILFYL